MTKVTDMTNASDRVAASEYVLGTDDIELIRLGVQHRLWSDVAHSAWRAAGLRPGHRVLDVGCGPGFASLDLAEWVGARGMVLGVDESAFFVESFQRRATALIAPNARAVVGDVQKLDAAIAMGAEPATSFDLAYARWVLCFVPDPDAVVAGMAAALRPGGRVVVHDYVNYEGGFACAHGDPRFGVVIRAIAKSWRDRGGNPDIVGRLPELFARHGLELEHHGVHQRIARPAGGAWSAMWSWPDMFWPSVLPRLVDSGHLTKIEKDAFDAYWRERAADPHWFMIPPPVHEMIAVRR